ncbi:uncharacterized protein LOC134233595 isoform X1 [Saccostrea cucullata]|uniref:uncharacterized protein LOC134233595 isoform X1 n=1 Tax=Saccostrea cuccullata TaxID=36930 RepID=UPI002ED04494
MRKITFLFVLQSCFLFSVSNVYSESEAEKWFNSGSSVISASKTSSGDDVRLQIEMSIPINTIVVWGVDQMIIGADEKTFGTSLSTLSNTTLFTLEIKDPPEAVFFLTFSDNEIVTTHMFDTIREDGTIKFDNPITCQSSFSKISDSEYDFVYRCNPELDPRNDWYMEVGMFTSFKSEMVEYKQIESSENKYVNLTTERNSTAKAKVVLSDETMERVGDFLFLQSSLTLPMDGLIKSILYRRVYDISKMKTIKKFKFLKAFEQEPLLEGEMVPINCEAIGRNPPPIQVKRDRKGINSSETIYNLKDNTNVWSISYVTLLRASKEIEGNYSCVVEMDGETFISPQKIEVNLKPRLRWDLTKILKSKQNQTRVRVVVEGAKGVVLNCRNNKWSRNRYLPMSTEKRTKISEWSERLETEYTWKRKNIDQDEFNSSLHSPFLSCIAEDKNGNLAFEHTF